MRTVPRQSTGAPRQDCSDGRLRQMDISAVLRNVRLDRTKETLSQTPDRALGIIRSLESKLILNGHDVQKKTDRTRMGRSQVKVEVFACWPERFVEKPHSFGAVAAQQTVEVWIRFPRIMCERSRLNRTLRHQVLSVRRGAIDANDVTSAKMASGVG